MATTGFWPIKGNLKDAIKYAQNPDKTTKKNYLDEDLYNALKYVSNDAKTDKTMFVSTINCPKRLAYESMMATKQRFGKLGGNVAYHGYQSFKIEEVTPEEAHSIGVATAKAMWGDEYEIVVTTHLNTENLHNHFVVNSVSFKTGRKFENHISDHYRLREISDSICREHNKSVLENSDFYGSNKKEYWIHKSGKLSHKDMLKKDLDLALSNSCNMEEFQWYLFSLGY
ncbi:MAG: relaxase/mobilization nuclease domain-containing protein, partial [Oscillospiraceae bacterium]|nr:relaxase/mobilization nuclease domain-containing protein [Oscillospiraceae bacterium]